MGGTSGHVSLGIAFFFIGLWHLFNCIKLHSLHPKSYTTLPWFPISRMRYIEPISIVLITTIFIIMELFNTGGRIPLAPDGTIPFKNLPHFEHSIIALSFLVYASFAVLLDKIGAPAHHELAHFLQSVAFGQQLLILHLHSTDHMGIEGQYHWLLQILTFICLSTTVLVIGYPKSFLNSFIRAFSVIFQGLWLVVMGFMLWTPWFLPKGCFLKSEMGRDAVRCHGERASERAVALVNLQFGLYLIVLTVFSISLYLGMIKLYHQEKCEYCPLTRYEEQEDLENCTVGEAGRKIKLCQSENSVPM